MEFNKTVLGIMEISRIEASPESNDCFLKFFDVTGFDGENTETLTLPMENLALAGEYLLQLLREERSDIRLASYSKVFPEILSLTFAGHSFKMYISHELRGRLQALSPDDKNHQRVQRILADLEESISKTEKLSRVKGLIREIQETQQAELKMAINPNRYLDLLANEVTLVTTHHARRPRPANSMADITQMAEELQRLATNISTRAELHLMMYVNSQIARALLSADVTPEKDKWSTLNGELDKAMIAISLREHEKSFLDFPGNIRATEEEIEPPRIGPSLS